MKSIIVISLLGLFLASCIKEQDDSNVLNIKRFYRYYISEMDKTFPRINFNEDTLQNYCTSSFLKKRKDDHEVDIVLQAQDYYIEWTKNLIVTPLKNTKNKEYNVCFPYGEGEEHNVIVTVKKEQGKYKISNIRGVE